MSPTSDVFDETEIKRHPNLVPHVLNPREKDSLVPDIVSIRWTGDVYQESWRKSPKFILYSAHFDARPKSGLVVRIVSLFDGEEELKSAFKFYCQMWFENRTKSTLVPLHKNSLTPLKPFSSESLNPYGITCKVPKAKNSKDLPTEVSLVNSKSKKPTNLLKIFGASLKKKREKFSERKNVTIGICGKALFYYNEDFSFRLIEWIETMKLLGASKIFLYKTTCHKNVQKVLYFYEKTGFVHLVTFYYPPPYVQEGTFLRLWTQKNRDAYRRVQHIYLNDCFLRNKDSNDYLGFFDCDEIPMLKKHQNLQNFIANQIKKSPKKEIDSFFLKWKHFYTDLQPELKTKNSSEQFYILRHNTRTKLDSEEVKVFETNGKSIYDTNRVLWVGIHEPISFLPHAGKTNSIVVNREIAYTAHYGTHKCRPNCNKKYLEKENALLHYEDKIINAVSNVCNILNLH